MQTTQEAYWIIDQLILQGVSQFCVSPGSRNSPLILAAAERREAQTTVHFDERGLGFFALGYGKGAKKPAAMIVTSGTAVGNLLPSIMEAYHSSTPLILLTADRPPELQSCGANQACDQIKIFSSYLRWEINLPPEQEECYFRSMIAQGVFHSLSSPSGPVQINCQLREPFIPNKHLPSKGKAVQFFFPKYIPESIQIKASKGVILIGAIESDIQPILKLAKRLKWPIFADILSNARNTPSEEQIIHFDHILKLGLGTKPDFIIHFGDRLTSKKILDWPVDLHVARTPYLQDPIRKISIRVQGDIDSFCTNFQAESDPTWLAVWKQKDNKIKKLLEEKLKSFIPFTESHFMNHLRNKIPSNCVVFLGNGMAIREADLFLFPKPIRGFFANRGLSGIDGNIATAAGLTAALATTVVAILGDQTCLHDLNSISLLKQTPYPLILIILNNFGGGIFSHLPVAKSTHFETHIASSHSLTFQKAAEMFDIPYSTDLDSLNFKNSSILEIQTSRMNNHQFHQSCL